MPDIEQDQKPTNLMLEDVSELTRRDFRIQLAPQLSHINLETIHASSLTALAELRLSTS